MGSSPASDDRSVNSPASAQRRIALRNDFSEITRFNELLSHLAEDTGLSKEQFLAVKLCAHEAIMNIMSYAFAGEHLIDVVVEVRPEEIWLEILDSGRPFDPLKVAPPSAAAESTEPRIGGQGIHLMRTFSKSLDYARVGGRNRLTISVAREEGSAGKS